MPNALVAAAATGLPSAFLNRRRMLLGLAAASSAAAAPVAASAVRPVENPALLQLGDGLPAVAVEFREANAARAAIVKRWAPKWPRAPEGLFYEQSEPNFGGPVERGLTGSGFGNVVEDKQTGRASYRYIHTVKNCRPSAEMWSKTLQRARHPATRARMQACFDSYAKPLALAEPYEAECERIRATSGYEAANKRFRDAQQALCDHVSMTLREDPPTMAGVVIQAEALEAVTDVEMLFRVAGEARRREDWATQIARSILRIAREATA